ncbi:MAG: LytR/AlgR family response regulator transcription factor [Anaerovoracaceae bacterium]
MDQSRVFDSFDVQPFHYIIKNTTGWDKFEDILLRAKQRADDRSREMIALSCAGENRSIPLDSILYFEVVQRIIAVHYDEEVFEFYSTIGKLENLLCRKGFLRVHRAYLVSRAHIAAAKSTELKMDNGDLIPIGRTYARTVKETLQKSSVQ